MRDQKLRVFMAAVHNYLSRQQGPLAEKLERQCSELLDDLYPLGGAEPRLIVTERKEG